MNIIKTKATSFLAKSEIKDYEDKAGEFKGIKVNIGYFKSRKGKFTALNILKVSVDKKSKIFKQILHGKN